MVAAPYFDVILPLSYSYRNRNRARKRTRTGRWEGRQATEKAGREGKGVYLIVILYESIIFQG